MTRNITPILGIVVVVASILAACLPSRPLPQLTAKPAGEEQPPYTLLPSKTPVPFPTFEPTLAYAATLLANRPSPYTPGPTLTSNELEQFVRLLQSTKCQLICYIGITPGKTSWEEAKSTLDRIGASYQGEFPVEDGLEEDFELKIGGEGSGITAPTVETSVGELEIRQDITLIIVDDTVQRVEASVQTSKFVSRFQQYWSRYMVANIFMQFGIPDDIVAHASAGGGYGLAYYYAKRGVVVEMNGTIQDNQICPGVENRNIGLHLILTNLASGLSLFKPGWIPPTDTKIWSQLDTILGINNTEFYHQLLSNPFSCFKIN